MRVPSPLRLAAVGLLLFQNVATAAADDPALSTGIRQVDEGDFEGAIATLTPVADRLVASRAPAAAAACLHLGIAHLALDQREPARRRFVQALAAQPGLRLGPDRYSPKVIAAFEEARREREKAAAKPAGSSGGSRKARTALLVAGGVGVGMGAALLARGGSSSGTGGPVRFTNARFSPAVVDCPDGSDGTPMNVAVALEATNDGGASVPVTSVSSTLRIVASPDVPSEIGNEKTAATVVTPSSLAPGTTTLSVRTTLGCWNAPGGALRYNEWIGRITLVTPSGADTLETINPLHVNIP